MGQKINEINMEFEKCYATDSDSLNVILYSEIINELKQIISQNNIEFVLGKLKRKVSLDNITTSQGIVLRMNRSIQAEEVFGVVKQDHGFRMFLLRGSVNVKIEFLIKALAYNIAKLHNKIISNGLGCSLFIKEIA